MTALALIAQPQIVPHLSLVSDVSGAETDAQLVDLWLHGRSKHTARAYAADAARFRAFVGARPLSRVTIRDLQSFSDSLAGATRARATTTVKSLLSYGQRIGYLTFNVGAALKQPKREDKLAQRILSEADVQRMLALETDPRNRALLRLLYAAGLRVSEICGLSVHDLQAREDGGQVTVFGKGSKTRSVRLPASIWSDLVTLTTGAAIDAPVFRSHKGGHLDASAVHRIVRKAARRAGIASNVSPHWLRHSHATHALDRGCPIHELQQTLGHSSLAVTSRYTHARPDHSSAMYLAV